MTLNLFQVNTSNKCCKSTPRNKNFRRFAYRIGNVLCITPWYDFNKEDLKRPILNKICAIVYCLVLGIILFLARVYRKSGMEKNIFEELLCLFSNGLSIFLTEYLIFGSTLITHQNWESFLRKLSMSQRMENFCDCKIFMLFYIQFILGHVLFIASFSYQGYTWYNNAGNEFILPFISMFIAEYYCFVYALVASNVALVIKCLYQDLNNSLVKYVELHCLRVDNGKTEEKIVKCILDVGKQYRYISELMDYYNKIFGVATLLMIWHAIVQLLRCVNIILVIMDYPTFSWPACLSLICISMLNMIESVSIILCCEMASSTGKKMERISHRLQENFDIDSSARKELFNLADVIRSHKPKFTAANFFVIRKGTILAMLSITTTYLIIMIQFNTKIQDWYFRNST